jgi:hypothetical protein
VTTREIALVQRIELQPAVEVNMLSNPDAQVDLTGAAGRNLDLFRESGFGAHNPVTSTAFELVSTGTQDASLTIGGDSGEIRNGMQSSTEYTVRGTIRIPSVLPGSALANRGRRIVVFTRASGGSFVETASAAAPNTVGNHDLSVTFTTPATLAEAFIRFYHGHTGGTVFWYRLRLTPGTSTVAFSGADYDGPYFTDYEHGWDGAPGITTSWRVNRADNTPLPDATFTDLEYDVRRVPYIMATIEMQTPDDAVIARLDPRQSRHPIINWNIQQHERPSAGAALSYATSAPMGYGADVAGKLYVRSLVVDEVSGITTLRAVSGEVITEDKHNIATVAHPTTADNVEKLVRFAVEDAGGLLTYVDPSAAATALPTGDRRIWMQGESLSQLYEPELAALDLRLFMDEVGEFHVRPFTLPPTWATPASVLEDGDDGTIQSFRSSIDRDDWFDATLVKADYDDSTGTRVTDMQIYPSTGANRKGSVTSIDRPIPSSTYAQSVVERAEDRSDRVEIVAQLDFAHRPGRSIDVTVRGNSATIHPEVVTYNPDAGTLQVVGYRI